MKYDIDNLNRVTKADEGTFSGGSISNRSREEEWLLTQVGNWDRAKIDLNGDGDFVDGGGELDDTRTHNVANELLTRDTDSNASVNYTLTHDDVGNMTDDGMSYKFVYDVFGRLRKITDRAGTPATIEEYRYNGLNHRLSWHYDTDGDADTDGSDKTYYFAYDDQWRIVGTFRETDSSPKERFLYHAAGLGGFGGASGGIGGYIDHVVLRDRDINSGWTSAADGTLEERRYYCQNWRADVSAVLTSTGKLVEWVKYSAGTPDSVGPDTPSSILKHLNADVRPFNNCLQAGCESAYLRGWPPNNGNRCPSNVPRGPTSQDPTPCDRCIAHF